MSMRRCTHKALRQGTVVEEILIPLLSNTSKHILIKLKPASSKSECLASKYCRLCMYMVLVVLSTDSQAACMEASGTWKVYAVLGLSV